MTMREGWTFEMPVGEVLEGAQKQLAYRQTRVEFWKDRRDEIVQKIREEGITINESEVEKLAGGTSYSNGIGNGVRVVIDNEMQVRLQEAQMKLQENREHVRQYQTWVDLLTPQSAKLSVKLDRADWLYFFGK